MTVRNCFEESEQNNVGNHMYKVKFSVTLYIITINIIKNTNILYFSPFYPNSQVSFPSRVSPFSLSYLLFPCLSYRSESPWRLIRVYFFLQFRVAIG